MHAWVRDRLLESPDEPALGVTDHGFIVGDGVFEAVKVVDGVPFALGRHLRRFARSAEGLGIPRPPETLVREAVDAVLAQEHLRLGKLRITWTAGPSPVGSGRATHDPTLVVISSDLEHHEASTRVVTVPWTRNEHGALSGLKTTSYGENVRALAYAHERDASEAIFANTAGNLCEGTGTNVFYAVDGELRTPSLASGCLAGITRELLLEWLPGVREVNEPLEILESADEIFLVSTTRDVQPVHDCDGRAVATDGPLTAQAQKTWAAGEAETSEP